MFVIRFLIATLCAAFATVAAAEPLRIDSSSALTALVRHFSWLESAGFSPEWSAAGQRTDFAVLTGEQALAARALGQPVKAVYVLSRTLSGDESQLLVVSEHMLRERTGEVYQVLAALERARLWLLAQPEAATQILGSAQSGRGFAGSRPGPAQLLALQHAARVGGFDAQLARALLDDSAYRAALTATRAPQIASLVR